MKALFITVILIAIVGYIGYEAWTVMTVSGFGHKIGQHQQAVDDLDK